MGTAECRAAKTLLSLIAGGAYSRAQLHDLSARPREDGCSPLPRRLQRHEQRLLVSIAIMLALLIWNALDLMINNDSVTFKTVPTDSTGVAHILEHTTLCGSTKYPVRDPFFNMLKRSLNTYMNAYTGLYQTHL